MSSKPKSGDYKPSEMEKTSAAVAQAQYNNFKQKYDPLLLKMRDKSLSDDPTRIARGRANADTMQTLTAQPTLRQATDVGSAGALAGGLTSQLGQATATGKAIQAKDQTNVLGTRLGQAADAQSGMSQLARMQTSEGLARAANRQAVAQSKYDAAGQIVGTAIGQGLGNLGSGDNATFFTPVGADGKKVTGLRDRFKYTLGGQ
jgi:hypothetical protein